MQPEITPMPKSVAEAVNAVMAKVKHVEKKGENKFHNYKFARVEDLLSQVQPAMVDAGLIIIQDELHHELIASEAVMTATYAFRLLHASGETWGVPTHHTGMAGARNSKGGFDDKALNKCHTAARKYFLLGLLQVPAGDLPDADAEEGPGAASQPNGRQEPRPEPKRAETKPPTLSERADRLAATLSEVKTAADLRKAYDLGAKLCADLDASDPERLVEINRLYERRLSDLEPEAKAA